MEAKVLLKEYTSHNVKPTIVMVAEENVLEIVFITPYRISLQSFVFLWAFINMHSTDTTLGQVQERLHNQFLKYKANQARLWFKA